MTEENTGPGEQRACAVCAQVLNKFTAPDGTMSWFHGYSHEEPDHPAVPVEQTEVRTEFRCDFCSTPEPTYVLPARNFTDPRIPAGAGLDLSSGGNWSVCADCVPLIETNQWSALLRRSARVWEERHGEPMPEDVKTNISGLWRLLRKNITGAVRPFQKPGPPED